MDSSGKSHDHGLKEPLVNAIDLQIQMGEIAGQEVTAEQVAETILNTLNEYGYIQYAPKGTLALLSAPGRVLVSVVANPNATLRELGMILGVSESTVAKQIAQLVDSKLITRTKVNGRNTYQIVLEEVVLHPDIRRFADTILRIADDVLGDSSNDSQ